MKSFLGLSYLGAFTSLGAATCCVLPMALMLFGVGGSWIAVFASIAATGWYVLAVSTAILVLAWIVAYRRGSLGHLRWRLAGSTALTAIALIVVLNEAQIGDYLISLM